MMRPSVSDPGRLIAHRGASQFAPENTLVAFRHAVEQGARWIEFDVSLLGDRTPVIFHDATLDRCTDTSGTLSGLTALDLAAIDAGNWHSELYRAERIPTLAQGLDTIAELGIFANLEIKPQAGDPEEIAAIVANVLRARGWSAEKIVVSSFSVDAVRAIRALIPEQPVAILWRDPPADWAQTAEDLGAEAVHLRYEALTSELLLEARRSRIGVRVYTINRPELMVAFRGSGLTGVITDHPPLFLEDTEWRRWCGDQLIDSRVRSRSPR